MVHPRARTMRVIFRRAHTTWMWHPRRMVWYGRFRGDWCPFRVVGAGAANRKLTGNTGQMVLSWLMPYFASARRPNRERTTKRHCVHTTWMWHPQRSVRAVPERLSPFPVFAYAARARAGGSLV